MERFFKIIGKTIYFIVVFFIGITILFLLITSVLNNESSDVPYLSRPLTVRDGLVMMLWFWIITKVSFDEARQKINIIHKVIYRQFVSSDYEDE
jgi:hypothetical protein